jgi:hypothetical protein
MRGSAHRKTATYTRDHTNTELTHTDIHAWSGIRTHDPSVRAGKDGSCHHDQLLVLLPDVKLFTQMSFNDISHPMMGLQLYP